MRATTALLLGCLGSLGVLVGCGGERGGAPGAKDPSEVAGARGPSADSREAYPVESTTGAAVSRSAPPSAPASGDAPRSLESSAEVPSGGQWLSPLPAPSPAPRDRPGLGTEWGETRESPIREVSFVRATFDQPFAVSQLFYNDRQGVEAMAAYRGGTPRFHDVPMASGFITVSVRDAWGEPLDAMRVGDRIYVVGQEGERYSIILNNRTGRRFEAVATVDGLDVISGKTGTFTNRGYVLLPWASLEIDGFRQSEDEVAAFRFSKVRDSYAAQRGQARNVGVIGIAFFAERGDDWTVEELRRRDTATPFPGEGRFAPPPR
jgi:hypothetical protein